MEKIRRYFKKIDGCEQKTSVQRFFSAALFCTLTPYLLHAAMVTAVAVYVLGGAVAIRYIEASQAVEKKEIIEKIISSTSRFRRKASLSRSRRCVQNVLREIVAENCPDDPMDMMSQLDDCYAADLSDRLRRTAIAQPIEQWNYWSMKDSILFCFTVITTIGYGNVVPQTTNGQMFVIAYGLIGVPFTMLVIANLGKFLAQLLRAATRWIFRLLRKIFCHSFGSGLKHPKEEEESDGMAPFGLMVAFIFYTVAGSMAMASYEPEMDFFKAIYFNFVTLTTIGLGDITPQSGDYLLFTLTYVALGLALTTIAIEIAADYLKKLHYFGRKMDNVGNVTIWFGGKKLTMKQLVKNLGDQFNLPVAEMETFNIDQFVDNAVKVESGLIPSLRDPLKCRPIFITDFKDPFRQGRILYVDEDLDERSSGVYTDEGISIRDTSVPRV